MPLLLNRVHPSCVTCYNVLNRERLKNHRFAATCCNNRYLWTTEDLDEASVINESKLLP